MEKPHEETAKPILIIERPKFMEPAPKSNTSPRSWQNTKTGLASESALRLDGVQPKTPKQKTE